ncbi:glutathione peroxidase [Thalassolituus sp. HI0120]|nr:glutathione peroxidase [Thalassolituus sp. HI0120]KZZ41472.1 glutathione peroxidase [Thalassolituus sp. HI0120]
MSDKPALPDRLSVNPKSKFYAEEYFEHEVGILLNGKERNNVEEYCISEGWVKVSSPVAKDRFGNPMLVKLKGEVEAFYK